MTREDALKLWLPIIKQGVETMPELNQALDMAIEALEQNPCEDWYDVPSDEMTFEQAKQAVKDLRKKLAEYLEQQPCDDCISRQAVLDIVNNPLNIRLDAIIKALPSVTPKEKTRKWIDEADDIDAQFGRHEYKCSVCGRIANYYVGGNECWWDIYKPNFCPNCGARMFESQESEKKE